MVLAVINFKIFYFIMIAHDKNQWINDFLCIAEMNSNNNCISHIPMCQKQLYFTNHTNVPLCQKSLHKIQFMVQTVINGSDILFHDECFNMNAQIILFELQKWFAMTTISHLIPTWIMSEITLNITLHSSNCNRFLRHFIP